MDFQVYLQKSKGLNQTFNVQRPKQMFFHSICLNDGHTQALGLCPKMNVHLYIVSSVDKIAAVIVLSIYFWRDATVADPTSGDQWTDYCEHCKHRKQRKETGLY